MAYSITIYSTSLCNLNCKYCFISKNNALVELDKYFEEASYGDYYINLAHEYVEDISEVDMLEIWGGEPTLHLDRSYNLIRQLSKESEKFKNILFSSNYCSNNFIEAFQGMVNLLGSIKDREFTIHSQISIDGVECITDKYRGDGVTKKVIENFNTLLSLDYPDNVKIAFSCKPTLSLETASLLLNKSFAIDYFKFFEDNFVEKVNASSNKAFLKMYPSIPNLACPSEYSSEDGKLFAEIERVLYEIEKENKLKNYFKYYGRLRMFSKRIKEVPKTGYTLKGGFCGTGRNMIGLLPFGKACGCHRDFTDFLERYRQEAREDKYDRLINMNSVSSESLNNKLLIFNNKYEAVKHSERMSAFYDNPSTTVITSIMAMIKMLSMTGQIDGKYFDEEECRKAAYRMVYMSSLCVENNISMTGNCAILPISEYRLFLNGALDYICKE